MKTTTKELELKIEKAIKKYQNLEDKIGTNEATVPQQYDLNNLYEKVQKAKKEYIDFKGLGRI